MMRGILPHLCRIAMFSDFRWLSFSPPDVSEAIATYNVTRCFYREVAQRQEFEQYCQWYYETAAKHQQELAKMQRDINVLGWFIRR